jgi:hypothetical protein
MKDIHNTDAKDLIARVRSLWLLVSLLRINRYDFPLDGLISSQLEQMRSKAVSIIKLISATTAFEYLENELLSTVDDIRAVSGQNFYTEENVKLYLSIALESNTVISIDFGTFAHAKATLAPLIAQYLYRCYWSICWLRAAFYSCYETKELPSLKNNWKVICAQLVEITSCTHLYDPDVLAPECARRWLESDLVLGLRQKMTAEMPYASSFQRILSEVEECASDKEVSI